MHLLAKRRGVLHLYRYTMATMPANKPCELQLLYGPLDGIMLRDLKTIHAPYVLSDNKLYVIKSKDCVYRYDIIERVSNNGDMLATFTSYLTPAEYAAQTSGVRKYGS